MIDELDEALRLLLIRELPVKNGEVDVQFHQPRREWSARLSRPTLNLFLYDVRENLKLRQLAHHWHEVSVGESGAVMRQRPVRVELYYAVTAWANEPEDEHRLLTRAIMVLFRSPELPDDLLSDGLRPQPAPITIQVAQPEGLQNPSDFWSAMDNEIRPTILCSVTMGIDPYRPATTPLVRSRGLRFLNADNGEVDLYSQSILWGISGRLQGLPPLRPVKMTLVERAMLIPVETSGAFTIPGIPEGEYTLEVSVAGGPPAHLRLEVLARSYEFELPKEGGG
jgi:hypothetical protein